MGSGTSHVIGVWISSRRSGWDVNHVKQSRGLLWTVEFTLCRPVKNYRAWFCSLSHIPELSVQY